MTFPPVTDSKLQHNSPSLDAWQSRDPNEANSSVIYTDLMWGSCHMMAWVPVSLHQQQKFENVGVKTDLCFFR